MICEHCGTGLTRSSIVPHEDGLKYRCPVCRGALTTFTFRSSDPCRLGPNVRVISKG